MTAGPAIHSRSSRFGRRRVLHWLIPVLLVLLFVSTLLWLPWQAQQMESNERQEQLIADTLWVEQTIRFQIGRNEESIRLIATEIGSGFLSGKRLQDRMQTLLRNNQELNRVVWFDAAGKAVESTDDAPLTLADLPPASRFTAEQTRSARLPQYSQPAPPSGLPGPMLMDYHVPLYLGDKYAGSLVATYSISSVLDEMVPWWFAQDNEISLTDSDDVVLAKRAEGGTGRGVYTHQRALDLPGATLILRTNSIKSAPKLLPNLLVGSVIALSLGLLWSLWALWRDINRRLAAEEALHQQVLFRAAMENSLVTGLRARDLEGRITYVNPAFCQMLGISADQILGEKPPMSYWAPEAIEEYQQRFSQVLAGTVTPQGFETVYLRANGERFPVLIFESPLVDDSGKQTGWMGSILDVSDLKRIEDLNRQQQEKLQASARLATMGEIASTLAHELNQPLAAISSYTTGALNLLENASRQPGGVDLGLLKPALEKTKAQAQRAGHIIRSVHTFVKRREPSREKVAIRTLVDSVMPLVELQAHRFFVAIQTNIGSRLPAVLADRVLIEQVLLNLTRNAIEAMEHITPERRILRIVAEREDSDAQSNVAIAVIDQGHGIPPEVAARLFSPFFSTKAEGMGIGLNICRTAVEFHGGTLTHADNPKGGTIFRFTLPAADAQARKPDQQQA
ncbi:sensor histidine kinase [Noviherbaspirillum cavernae]|uniref:sensor histidine kinase n=1 Tax=Noviherbaspirillum cavernae TaxID=2320862 RepID=UPI0018F4ADB8|nr:PAS domain S-box protein [Noviherbaspirillum cavernae]